MGRQRGNTMHTERFEQIVETYGSQPVNWPAQEREAAEHLLRESSRARQLLQEQQTLDDMLNRIQVPAMAQMENRILRSLRDATRASLLDRVLDWMLPRRGTLLSWAWRPTLAAALPLVCGIYLANYYSFGIDETENSWQEELYLISMNDYAEISE